MASLFPPALLFLGAALLIPFFRGTARKAFILAVPVVTFWQLTTLPLGAHWTVPFLNAYDLTLLKVEPIRLCFAYVFVIMAFLASTFALHERKPFQHMAAFAYVGSSLGVAFAGDFFTLFIFWELMAVTSAAIIFLRNTKAAREAGQRYLLVHIAGGACLMAGVVFQLLATGSLAIVRPEPGLAFSFILVGFCLNAAVPPLSAWLSDAYPEGSVTGSIYLTAYTTKTAVLTLALVFPGTEILVWGGAIMALYGVVFAVLENDIRRLLAYHIISQVGYMVCGVGLGSALALNGVTSHAFCHILYKGLLFMGAGAVIYATGKRQLSELGGIWRLMPVTVVLYMIGAFSISGVPGFNGFVSKTMIISAAGGIHRPVIELMLLLASIGTFLHTGLKLPYFTFVAPKNRGLTVRSLPINMHFAMGGAAFLCTFIGVYPEVLYNILPFGAEYHPYTPSHVIGEFQLLIATGIAFMVYIDQLGGHPAITLDTDWFYRRGATWFFRASDVVTNSINATADNVFMRTAAPRLARYMRDGASNIVLNVLTPLWSLDGVEPKEIAHRKIQIRKMLSTGSVPIGVSAFAATIVFIVFFTLM
ncbi:Na(+)/H(+) antiporter subunit D [Desulfohalobium retbaense]|uniref:NADH/Ubiquinone/plastoquinone (Complex I) n=1 Tax=Desulfohalobium retbaense (strain ATCC 49708 / DSM 5692 / JCM 16813 / HR100) TaxID=485915 RepID=C8X0Y3_DESRD|nr:Na(+)/H(+) antiporter subunit D [Desulfohalobium retbaense]ACV68080.1 NADH/Ubiquinone/plastoquinone (complex I) [Desulfohalobium retbaense DSM 5692]